MARHGSTHGRDHARATARKQATRFAVLAFVAADCAGIYYVQHRLDNQAATATELAYQTPGAPDLAGPASLTFTPDAPSLALNVPVAGVAAGAVAAPAAPGSAMAAPVAARPALLAYTPAPLPSAADAGHGARANGAVLASAQPANPLTAQRIAPAGGLGAPHMAVRLAPTDHAASAARSDLAQARPMARASAHGVSHSAPAANLARSSVFDSAFTLADESPDSEHRFGQSQDGADSGNVSGTGLAGLVIPRDETTPIFDKAGIAPVTGQSATVDVPAATDLPADGAAAELPPIRG